MLVDDRREREHRAGMPNAQFFSPATRSCRDDLCDLVYYYYLCSIYIRRERLLREYRCAGDDEKTRVIELFTIFLLHAE